MNSEKTPHSGDASRNSTVSRRSFVKRAAGTVLLFGLGMQVHQALAKPGKIGARTYQVCGYGTAKYTCYFYSVSELKANDYWDGGDPTGCTKAQNGGTTNCVLVQGKKQCAPTFASGRPERESTGTKNNWCIY